MYFKSLKVKNFRNYKEESIEFSPGLNLILGKNAQGKTNLLEALFIMGLGKSFKTASDKEMILLGEDYARASCIVVNEDGEETEIEITYKNEGKIIKVDGIKLSRNIDLLENVYVVVFSPEDLRIIKDGPDQRRRFLDRELCQIKPVYYSDLGNYKKIIKQRNILLRDQCSDKKLFEVFDEALADYGTRITEERRKFIDRLSVICREIHRGISNGLEELELVYETSVKGKEHMLEMLRKKTDEDMMRGYTSFGPHKDFITININGMNIRNFGSQGQQRTAALSLKLAEISLIRQETGHNAVLLLDDVFSELDSERQRFLIETMKEAQIFVTAAGMEDSLKEMLPHGNIYYVDKGKVNIYN